LRLLPGRGCGAGAAVANVCPPALSRCQTCTPMQAPPLQHSPDGPGLAVVQCSKQPGLASVWDHMLLSRGCHERGSFDCCSS